MKYLKYLKKYSKGYLKAHLKKTESFKNKPYKDIGILNPSIGSANLGDKIIYDSVYSLMRDIYPNGLFTDYPTQLYTSYDAKMFMREKDLLFVSGTNLLSSNMETRHQWKIDKGHKKFLNDKVVLLGCGWWQYQGDINNYTRDIYKSVLNKKAIHSVRDQYTANKFKSIGINNVINTTCPTLWSVTPDKCAKIPQEKGEDVVTTLTCYHKSAELDKKMLNILSENYQKVFLWIQGMDDVSYFDEINTGLDNIKLIAPTIEAYNKILERSNIDYIGTRLHAGIRALQKEVRTMIIAVDNRAYEIGNDVNLNVIKREDVEEIRFFINKNYKTHIQLPMENIQLFKNSLVSV